MVEAREMGNFFDADDDPDWREIRWNVRTLHRPSGPPRRWTAGPRRGPRPGVPRPGLPAAGDVADDGGAGALQPAVARAAEEPTLAEGGALAGADVDGDVGPGLLPGSDRRELVADQAEGYRLRWFDRADPTKAGSLNKGHRLDQFAVNGSDGASSAMVRVRGGRPRGISRVLHADGTGFAVMTGREAEDHGIYLLAPARRRSTGAS